MDHVQAARSVKNYVEALAQQLVGADSCAHVVRSLHSGREFLLSGRAPSSPPPDALQLHVHILEHIDPDQVTGLFFWNAFPVLCGALLSGAWGDSASSWWCQ